MLYRKVIILITIGAFSFASNFLRIQNFNGLDLKTAPDKIQNDRARDITNLDFDVMGSLQTRKGIAHQKSFDRSVININDRANTNYILDGEIHYKDQIGEYSVNQYTNIGDDIYFFGQDMVKWSEFYTEFTGLGHIAPNYLDAEIMDDVTGNLNGTYNYAVTYVYENRYESQPYFIEKTATGSVEFTNSLVAIDLGDDKKFYLQFLDQKYFGYYIDNDVVQVKRQLVIDGDIVWKYYESGYMYLVARKNFSTYFYYKINIANVNIERQAQADYSSLYTSSQGWRGTAFFVDSDGVFYKAVGTTTFTTNLAGNTLYKEYVTIYTYEGNWSHPTQKQQKLLVEQWLSQTIGSVLGLYKQGLDYYVITRVGTNANPSLKIWRLSDGASKQAEHYTVSVPFPPGFRLEFKNHYPIIMLDNGYYFSGINAMSWDYPTGRLDLKATYYGGTFPGYTYVDYISTSTQDLQAVIDNTWYEYDYDLTVPTINVSTSDVWDIETTATKVTALNQKIRLFMPTPNERVTGINLYRQLDGTGFFFLDSVVLGNTTYIDNIGNLDQSVIPMEIDNETPPQAIDSEYIVARQFYLAPDGVVWYSKINNFDAVPASNYIRIRTEADDNPKRIIEHFGGLLIFFQKSIWYIDLQSPNTLTWVPRKLNTDFGSPYRFSIVKGKLPNQQIGVFYMAEDRSVRVLTGIGSDGIQLFDNIYTDKLSLPIDPITRADRTNVNDVYFAFNDYKLYVSIDDYFLVWDSQRGGEWTKYDFPIEVTYVGTVGNDLIYGNNNRLYETAKTSLFNYLPNSDFRKGFEEWEKVGDIKLSNNGVRFNGGFVYQDFSVPDDGEDYFLRVESNAEDGFVNIQFAEPPTGDITIITRDEFVKIGGGTFFQQISGDVRIGVGGKIFYEEPTSTADINTGWSFISIISGESMLVSEIISYLEAEMGADSITDILYFVDGVETYYSISGDATINYGEAYWINSTTQNMFSFEPIIPESITISFVEGFNAIFGYPYNQYYASDFLDLFGGWATELRINKGGWKRYRLNDPLYNEDFIIGGKDWFRGLYIEFETPITYKFSFSKGEIFKIEVVTSTDTSVYYDFMSKEQNIINNSFEDGLDNWFTRYATISGDSCQLLAPYSPPGVNTDAYIQQTITVDIGRDFYIYAEFEKISGLLFIQGFPVSGESVLGVLSSDTKEYTVEIRTSALSAGDLGLSLIHGVSLRYVSDNIPIDWNYKTKVFGDSFEYYQDFDKIWLRGIQTEESDIRVDYTCNNNLGNYSDYILMTLYGDSIVNTGVNSLLGAGGRDIQVEISGQDYIRLDGLSIKRTLREE